jgi:hypothetical protein
MPSALILPPKKFLLMAPAANGQIIGRACLNIGEAGVKEHGKKKGKALEAVFAPGHYFAMFWVNVAGLTKYGFTGKKKREELKSLDTANR